MARRLGKGEAHRDDLEHATTALAFYAVGLQPAGSPYGADVTFVRWAANWWLSRPYLGGMYGTAPDWASVDLFVNNGAGSQWNVVVNVPGSNGLPTTFENTVYCRVRNVGDEDALNVHVDLFYAAAGTAPVVWLPVADKNGASPGLTIAQLAAGQSSFPDADQQTPPASAGVQWCIPPLSPGAAVDHFCLKAVVTADNDVNPFNNEVQSNVTYVLLVVGKPFKLALWTANRTARAIPLELGVETTLPHGWEVETEVGGDSASMEPHEERLVVLRINAPAHALERLEPPFDGEITATLSGPLSGKCHGALTATRGGPDRLTREGRTGPARYRHPARHVPRPSHCAHRNSRRPSHRPLRQLGDRRRHTPRGGFVRATHSLASRQRESDGRRSRHRWSDIRDCRCG